MSGRRPSSTRTWNFKTSFRESGVDAHGVPGSSWSTLPQAFKEAGYVTIGMGKLFHPGSPKSNDCPQPHPKTGAVDCPSWSTSFETAQPANVTLDGHTVLECGSGKAGTREGAAGVESGKVSCSFTYVNPNAQIFTKRPATLENDTTVEVSPACAALPDANCTDEWLADAALPTLRAAARSDRPFFFAAGFHKCGARSLIPPRPAPRKTSRALSPAPWKRSPGKRLPSTPPPHPTPSHPNPIQSHPIQVRALQPTPSHTT